MITTGLSRAGWRRYRQAARNGRSQAYDLRRAAVSLWSNAGVPATESARLSPRWAETGRTGHAEVPFFRALIQ